MELCLRGRATVATLWRVEQKRVMWNQPYLETCCRSALHRLHQARIAGRPDGLKDGPCLRRLAGMGLTEQRDGERWWMTAAGSARHESEVLKLRAVA